MNATVTWSGRMTFAGKAESGFSIPLGTDPDVGGDSDGFRPIELLLIGLAGCTAMDVISILQKKRQAVHSFEVQAEAERATEHPRVLTRIHLQYRVIGKAIEPAAVARAIELSETKYCPAHAMLRPAVPITSSFEILEVE
jgi:putative redox protein